MTTEQFVAAIALMTAPFARITKRRRPRRRTWVPLDVDASRA